jgi:hypothetical protein
MGVEMGESVGVLVADISDRDKLEQLAKGKKVFARVNVGLRDHLDRKRNGVWQMCVLIRVKSQPSRDGHF